MSNNINLSDGFKEVTINNDKNRVIRINPTDINFITRYNETVKKLDELNEKYANIKEDDLSLEEQSKIISEIDNQAKEYLDYIVGSPVSEIVFGTASCLSLSGGQTVLENFLESYVGFMAPTIKEEYKKSRQRVNKYTSQAKRVSKK